MIPGVDEQGNYNHPLTLAPSSAISQTLQVSPCSCCWAIAPQNPHRVAGVPGGILVSVEVQSSKFSAVSKTHNSEAVIPWTITQAP